MGYISIVIVKYKKIFNSQNMLCSYKIYLNGYERIVNCTLL